MTGKCSVLDGRTREARLVREFRAGLIQHVGGEPSAPQRELIERATQIKLRLAEMDQRFSARGTLAPADGRDYLAAVNSLARLLHRLGATAS